MRNAKVNCCGIWEKGAEILKDTFEELTDEQKVHIMADVMDVLDDSIIYFDLPRPLRDTEEIFLKSIFDRAVEIMPSLKDILEKDYKESLDELHKDTSRPSVELTGESS